jgi:AcrR family transcriptional regulator
MRKPAGKIRVTRPPRQRRARRMRRSERREQILDAALHLIAEHGYAAATMEGIARAAAVTRPVVYDQFGTREELLHVLVAREEERALAELSVVVPLPPDERDPDDVLAEGVTAFLGVVAANTDRWRLILQPVEGTPALVREHVDSGRRAIAERLEAVLAWGVEQRGGPRGVDVELLAQMLVGAAEHAGRLVLADPGRFTPERFGAATAGMLRALARGPR